MSSGAQQVIPDDPMQYWILEWNNGVPIKLHHIVNPGRSEKGGYLHIRSAEAFWWHEVTRQANRKTNPRPIRYSLYRHHEYEENGLKNRFDKYSIEESGTIFEFYNKVGYDYKKKRFLPRETA